MQYFYRIAQGKATLTKTDDMAIKVIGQFKTDIDAKNACEKHYQKACKMLANLNKPLPEKFYF